MIVDGCDLSSFLIKYDSLLLILFLQYDNEGENEQTMLFRSLCDEMTEVEQTSKKALRQSLQEKLLVQQQCEELKVSIDIK